MAMRFMNGLSGAIAHLDRPRALKVVVETLGFQHLELDVTVPRVAVFRDAIVDLLGVELGARLSTLAREGWLTVLNHIGGSFIYIRMMYADRLRILASSWAQANSKARDELDVAREEREGESREKGSAREGREADEPEQGKRGKGKALFSIGKPKGGKRERSGERRSRGGMFREGNRKVPTTYAKMFRFNAAVMGFGDETWMEDVLASFDAIVSNVSNSHRLQESATCSRCTCPSTGALSACPSTRP